MTSGDQVVQPLCSEQHLLEQTAEDHDHEIVIISKAGDSTTSGQPVAVSDHAHSNKSF